MGVGFRLTLRWGIPVQSRFVNKSSKPSSSSSVRGKEASITATRLCALSVVSEEGDIIYRDPVKTYAYLSAIQTSENDCAQMEGVKVNLGRGTNIGSSTAIGNTNGSVGDVNFSLAASLKDKRTSQFSLLMENLVILEESFADSDVLKLERDILLQLERLGALKLFNTYLSRTLKTSNFWDLSDIPVEKMEECRSHDIWDDDISKIIVHSGKKGERKSRRERATSGNDINGTSLSLLSATSWNEGKASNSKSRRLMIARNEAEMARGVKVLSDLEDIRTTLEEGTGRVVSLSCWAEAAGLDKKLLMQQLRFGWYCRDELLRSTQSLVLFLARNYRGLGISVDDLLQAGNLGVLQGAERFDHMRGYRFSTYVQYWIRRSLAKTVAQHSRGIRVPCALSQVINQIQKARKSLSHSQGKYPDDNEIAKFTGLPLTKVQSASKCLRVVGSIDRKVGEFLNAKYLEFIPDTSIQSPEEAVLRQCMRKDIYNLLKGLGSKERRVLLLRYGFKDHQGKSLEEIGKLLNVSKEWVRRIEKKVLTSLRNEEALRNLRHYRNL